MVFKLLSPKAANFWFHSAASPSRSLRADRLLSENIGGPSIFVHTWSCCSFYLGSVIYMNSTTSFPLGERNGTSQNAHKMNLYFYLQIECSSE